MGFKKRLTDSQKKEWEKQMSTFRSGTAEIVPQDELEEKVAKSLVTGVPLKIKLGLDPSAPDVHLGHTVVLNKLKQFQDAGHAVQLIIGDFTGKIGDPTGKSDTRNQLTDEQVRANAATYVEQFKKVINMERAEIHYNSKWLEQLKFDEIIQLASQITVARLLERNDFSNRMQQQKPISVHEFFYPIMQGFDSVQVEADIEIGGTDQHFNLLMGRHFQEKRGMDKQVAIMMPLLEGLDGVEKMSKSKNNYIGIDESPKEIYGKTMSLPDGLMIKFFQLVTNVSTEEIEQMEKGLRTNQLHPKQMKMRLAKNLVERWHSVEEAEKAEKEFIEIFQKSGIPEQIPVLKIEGKQSVKLIDAMVEAGLVKSKTEAKKMIANRGVRLNQEKVENEETVIESGAHILQVGKRKFVHLKFI